MDEIGAFGKLQRNRTDRHNLHLAKWRKNGILIAYVPWTSQRKTNRETGWTMESKRDQINPQEYVALLPMHYHSVEFALDPPFPIYQFKLWRAEQDRFFLLVKDNSALLPQLKEGRIVAMKYMSAKSRGRMDVRHTRIKRIVNEGNGRFQGHHRVELAIVASDRGAPVQ
jgi:hypothetical protein